jgi:adenosylcobinamide-GDP ribazoletransferase
MPSQAPPVGSAGRPSVPCDMPASEAPDRCLSPSPAASPSPGCPAPDPADREQGRDALHPVVAQAPEELVAHGAWPSALVGARAAFVSFSRLPLGGFPYRASDWHWAPAHLPLVGAVVGAVSAGVFLAAGALGLGPLLRASLALTVSIWLTGALHEDGLADSADGLGAARGDRERALAIMKDSRIGTYGAAALIVSSLWRAAALAELPASAWFAIVYVHVWARVAPVWLLCSEKYLDRPAAKSQGLFRTRPRHVLVALGWGGAAAALGGAAEQVAELGAWLAVSATLAH